MGMLLLRYSARLREDGTSTSVGEYIRSRKSSVSGRASSLCCGADALDGAVDFFLAMVPPEQARAASTSWIAGIVAGKSAQPRYRRSASSPS
jgi:hypothetical protein